MRHPSSSVQPNVVPSQKTTDGVKSMWTTPIYHQVTILTQRERKHRQTLTMASHLSLSSVFFNSTLNWTSISYCITLTASHTLKKAFHLTAEYIELSISLFNIVLPLIYYKIVCSDFCQIAYLVLNPNHLRKKEKPLNFTFWMQELHHFFFFK